MKPGPRSIAPARTPETKMTPHPMEHIDIIAIERAARAERARLIAAFLSAAYSWSVARIALAIAPRRAA
jgi:hypothetical protein